MPQGSPTRTVGARLREAREKRGVSLRQIASNTRISVMSLEALERSDLSRLPGGIFTRAFIRAYAEQVGLDGSVPYDLRHSFASLLIAEGKDLAYVARQLGNSPETCCPTRHRKISSPRVFIATRC